MVLTPVLGVGSLRTAETRVCVTALTVKALANHLKVSKVYIYKMVRQRRLSIVPRKHPMRVQVGFYL